MANSFRAERWLCGFFLFLFLAASCTRTKPQLPELPALETANFLPAVRLPVETAYRLAQRSPNNSDAVGKLGMLLDAHDQYEAAASCYQRAHGLDPQSFRWTYYLGIVRASQGKWAEAITDLQNALRLRPDYAPARLRLAESLLAGNRLTESEKEYQAVLTLHPDSAAANYGLGRVYASMDATSKSLSYYQRACELFPDYGAAHYALALLYRKLGRTEESSRHLRSYEGHTAAAPPENDPLRREVAGLNAGAMSHLRRAAALEQSGNIAEAVAEHEQALEIDPGLVQAHVNLVSLYGKLGELSKAETHFRSAVGLDPKQADAYYNYGVLLFQRKQYPEAGRQFRETLRINPSHAPAHHNLGFLFEQQGNLKKALEEYELAAASQAGYRLAHFHAGRILAAEKRFDTAIAHFQKTLQPEDESTPAYLYALAAAYARSGNRAEAIKVARRARSGAAAFGQSELLAGIDKDLATLEGHGK